MRSNVLASPRRKRPGFTLVEIMAATGIMLVVILLVLSLTTNILGSWTQSTGQLRTNFEARVALDLMTSDLESMEQHKRNICWLQVDYQSVGPTGDTHVSPILYFFASAIERPRKKDANQQILDGTCAISYRLDFKNPFLNVNLGADPSPVYGLYRSVIDSENTFEDALAITDFDPASFNTTSLEALWSGQALSADGSGNIGLQVWDVDINGNPSQETVDADWITGASNFLSQHVAKFEVLFWYKDQNGDLLPATDDGEPLNGTNEPVQIILAGSSLYLSSSQASTPTASDRVPGARLVYADITLTLLDSEGAQQFNQGLVNHQEAIEQYGRVFSRRVNLMSGSL